MPKKIDRRVDHEALEGVFRATHARQGRSVENFNRLVTVSDELRPLERYLPHSALHVRPAVDGIDIAGKYYVQIVVPVESREEQQRIVRRNHLLPGNLPSRFATELADGARELAEAIGDFYTAKQLAEQLGQAPSTISRGARSGHLLRLRTSDGHYVYPAAQFDNRGDAPDGLADVVRALNDYYGNDDGWSAAFWLTGPIDPSGSDTRTHLEVLREDGPARVLAEVQQMTRTRDLEGPTVDGEPDLVAAVVRSVFAIDGETAAS